MIFESITQFKVTNQIVVVNGDPNNKSIATYSNGTFTFTRAYYANVGLVLVLMK